MASLSLSSMAQQSVNSSEALNQINLNGEIKETSSPQLNYEAKALGTTFWHDSLNNANNWVIDNGGQSSPFGWNIGTNVNSWWSGFSGGINSTSASNGFAEVYNGDYNSNNQAINVTYTLTTAAAIDAQTLGGTDQISLSFEQFGAKFNDAQTVLISTDGSTFQEVYSNADKVAFIGDNPSAYYANPETVVVNIAEYVAGNAGSIWIRFQWTSAIPSNSSLGAWTTFGWFIDDVKLMTNPDNNLSPVSTYWGSAGLNYNQIPNTQIAPIAFSANTKNNGIATQNNAMLNVEITGNETSSLSSAAGTNIAPGATDSLFVTEFTPNGTNGSYAFTWNISQDETDDMPADNDLGGGSFSITDYTYARDLGTPSGTSSNQAQGFEVGNLYDIVNDANIYSIDAHINGNTDAGTQIFAKIYSIDSEGGFVQEDQTNYYELTASDIGGIVNMDLLSGPSGFAMTAGQTYLVTVGSDGSNGSGDDLVVSTSGKTAPHTAFLYDTPTTTWFYTTNIPMVRMNLDPTSNNVGIEENTLEGVAIFPNPTTGVITISNDNQTDNKIEVRDLTGKLVTSTSAAIETTIDLTGNPSGIYMVKVYNENGATIEKVTLK